MTTKLVTLHSELQRHAFINMINNIDSRMFLRAIKADELDPATFTLAKFIKRDTDRVNYLETFFTIDAILWLMKMPNHYWFWKIVHDAVAFENPADPDSVITGDAVRKAIVCNQRAQMHRYSIDEDVKELDREDIGDRLQHGIYLFKFGDLLEGHLYPNIIFFRKF